MIITKEMILTDIHRLEIKVTALQDSIDLLKKDLIRYIQDKEHD